MHRVFLATLAVSAVSGSALAAAADLSMVGVSVTRIALPVATVDLSTESGAALMKATWRYSDARLVEVPFRAADERDNRRARR